MMEAEEIIKVVNGIYKNILENFNPGARQMISAGKAYLKALHDAAAASRIYVDAIGKLAQQAQQGTWGGSTDIGSALMRIVEVYKEIQEQQVNILKAFYVDLLVPLETNLEKDTKVIQSERKRFVQQHKQRLDTYIKTTALMKKQRKKVRGSGKSELAMDKELKNMKLLEIEKSKLDLFYEQSLKNAMTQERRRYGFVLERQCSLSKHYMSYYTYGTEAFSKNIDQWSDVAKTREILPKSGENLFSRLGQMTSWQEGGGGGGDDLYSNPRSANFDEDSMSMNSQLRKTKASTLPAWIFVLWTTPVLLLAPCTEPGPNTISSLPHIRQLKKAAHPHITQNLPQQTGSHIHHGTLKSSEQCMLTCPAEKTN
nr:unnamed protein product [Callosobruchus chinensis]